jgi:hypothetical protein
MQSRSETVQITDLVKEGAEWGLRWQSDFGTAFTVQYQETLQDGIWRLPRGDFPVTTNHWAEASSTNSLRFFRVLSVPEPQRGKLLEPPVLVRTVPMTELAVYYNLGLLPIMPRYSVRLYKIVYETITPLGARTKATGALALPEGTGQLLRLMSYQHGTLTQTNSAPSLMNITGEIFVAVAFATSGYAVVEADYLGLGDSPGLHPFHHARSEATAGVDLLRAAKNICATNGFPLSDHLFLCGYSQGGHATMALLRELEMYHTNEFTVTACAPMAGAYDLSGVTAADFLSGRTLPNPYYFLYLVAAYQDVYHLAPSLAGLLVAPYNTTLPPLLHGNTSGGSLNSALPADPTLILKPEYLAAFRSDPRHPLRLALQENDLYRWKPSTPLRLYHCSGDQDVIVANSQVAAAAFQASGATNAVWIDPLPGANHGGCSQPSLIAAKLWFDSFP